MDPEEGPTMGVPCAVGVRVMSDELPLLQSE